MESLNLEGQPKGDGVVTQKSVLVNGLSRSVAGRATILDFTIGRKGLVTFFKSLSEGEVEILPRNGHASDTTLAERRLRVVCGANIAELKDMAWVNQKTPLSLCEVKIGVSGHPKPAT